MATAVHVLLAEVVVMALFAMAHLDIADLDIANFDMVNFDISTLVTSKTPVSIMLFTLASVSSDSPHCPGSSSG